MKKLILLLLPLLILTACSGAEDPESLIGTWSVTTGNEAQGSYTTQYRFNDDGTYEITSTSTLASGIQTQDGQSVFTDTKTGKYTVDGDGLTLQNEYTQEDGKKNQYEVKYTYKIEGDTLTLETEQGAVTTYVKVQE